MSGECSLAICCITFYAPDIIPRKSMEGHGPSPSPSLRAGALSSFSTLHLYPFTKSDFFFG